MAEETITILKVGTEEAVKSIADLKENVRTLKKTLEETQVDTQEGWLEYQKTLDLLKVNQNALKDAMYATSGTFQDVTKAATGASESYNSLVHRMAELKEEFRATNDEVRRAELGVQIKSINDQLKDLDALQGNFQRNVGNYANSIKDAFGDMSKNVDVFSKSMKSVGGGLNGLKDGMEGISKSPMIATIGILVSLAVKLAGELKENETAMAALKKAMAALQPVMDFLSGLLDKVAGFLADIIGKVVEFVTNNGLFDKITKAVMGVGNTILKFVIAPFKGVIAAIKVFKEQGIKGIGDAARAFGKEMKEGVSFKENFKAGQAVADTFIAGAKSKKKAVKDAGQSLSKDARDGFLEGLEADIDRETEKAFADMDKAMEDANKNALKREADILKNLDKATSHRMELNDIMVEDDRQREEYSYQIMEEANQKKLSLLDKFKAAALDRGDLDAYLAYDQERADLEVEIETNALREKMRLRKLDMQDAEEKAKAQKDILKSVAGATSNILSSIADMYEDDTESSERNANRVKNLRIAAATIDTISGAIGAYMQAAATIPPPLGTITGAIQAAAVTAAGVAQIAKIKNTKVSGTSSSAMPVSAMVAAPTLTTNVDQVRSVTTASEEDRLNRMARDQRVYILASDIEASQTQIRTQVTESSF